MSRPLHRPGRHHAHGAVAILEVFLPATQPAHGIRWIQVEPCIVAAERGNDRVASGSRASHRSPRNRSGSGIRLAPSAGRRPASRAVRRSVSEGAMALRTSSASSGCRMSLRVVRDLRKAHGRFLDDREHEVGLDPDRLPHHLLRHLERERHHVVGNALLEVEDQLAEVGRSAGSARRPAARRPPGPAPDLRGSRRRGPARAGRAISASSFWVAVGGLRGPGRWLVTGRDPSTSSGRHALRRAGARLRNDLATRQGLRPPCRPARSALRRRGGGRS